MAIMMPTKKPDEDNSFFGQIAKPVQGLSSLAALVAAIPGPHQPVAAAAAAAGNAAGSIHNMNKPDAHAPQQTQGLKEQAPDAIARKLESMNNDPGQQIVDAGKALNNMPPEIQQEYKPILQKAFVASRRV